MISFFPKDSPLSSIQPRTWKKVFQEALDATREPSSKKRFPLSPLLIKWDSALRWLYEYELKSGIPGSASNPVWSVTGPHPGEYRSLIIPDFRKCQPIMNEKGVALAGSYVPREAALRVELWRYPPEIWAALEYHDGLRLAALTAEII